MPFGTSRNQRIDDGQELGAPNGLPKRAFGTSWGERSVNAPPVRKTTVRATVLLPAEAAEDSVSALETTRELDQGNVAIATPVKPEPPTRVGVDQLDPDQRTWLAAPVAASTNASSASCEPTPGATAGVEGVVGLGLAIGSGALQIGVGATSNVIA